LSGNGGDGKSLIVIQLGIAVASESDWLGHIPMAGPVIIASAEDERDEIHRRIVDIIRGRLDTNGDPLTFEKLADLHIIDLTEIDALFMIPDGRAGILSPPPLMIKIEEQIAKIKPVMVAIDASADVYGGDENVRPQVRQFLSFLRRLAQKYNTASILISHPSLSGMASGSGTSGNTAWNNSVRSRIYVEPVKTEKNEEPDPMLRRLTRQKTKSRSEWSVHLNQMGQGKVRPW
jgi:RecA-family ATPase